VATKKRQGAGRKSRIVRPSPQQLAAETRALRARGIPLQFIHEKRSEGVRDIARAWHRAESKRAAEAASKRRRDAAKRGAETRKQKRREAFPDTAREIEARNAGKELNKKKRKRRNVWLRDFVRAVHAYAFTRFPAQVGRLRKIPIDSRAIRGGSLEQWAFPVTLNDESITNSLSTDQRSDASVVAAEGCVAVAESIRPENQPATLVAWHVLWCNATTDDQSMFGFSRGPVKPIDPAEDGAESEFEVSQHHTRELRRMLLHTIGFFETLARGKSADFYEQTDATARVVWFNASVLTIDQRQDSRERRKAREKRKARRNEASREPKRTVSARSRMGH
jgi:hypothetical protein